MEFSGFKKYNARVNGTFKKGRLTVSETLSAAFTNKEPQVRMVMGCLLYTSSVFRRFITCFINISHLVNKLI